MRQQQEISSVRVPFGKKAGRLWSARQVESGLACDCTCPGCGARLVARNAGQKRCAHFAHHEQSECAGGFESAVHLMAKQLLSEQCRVVIPAWVGTELMPNPPVLSDDDGGRHFGESVNRPAENRDLERVLTEVWLGDYRPDVAAVDQDGELLIEIRVSHAVGDTKARNVQSEGRRMFEINLSGLTQAQAEDPEAFEKAVLADPGNRHWISHPSACDDWRGSLAELKARVAARNLEIAAEAEQWRRAQAKRIEEQREAAARKAWQAQQLRMPFERTLTQLNQLTSRQVIADKMTAMRKRDEQLGIETLTKIGNPSVVSTLQEWGEHSWAYNTHPLLWQARAFLYFIDGKQSGDAFSQVDLSKWVRKTAGIDNALWQLFYAQDKCRREARMRGRQQRMPWAWFLTHEENWQIPNFWAPINGFVDRLMRAGVVSHDLHRFERIIVL